MAETTTTPTQAPVTAGQGTAASADTAPTLTAPATATNGAAVSEQVEPQLQPGADAAALAAAGAITGTWATGAVVDALWSINETRNAWMHVASVGWKKVYNGSDGAFTALTTLASQARQTGHTVSYRLEADGMVHEIYLW